MMIPWSDSERHSTAKAFAEIPFIDGSYLKADVKVSADDQRRLDGIAYRRNCSFASARGWGSHEMLQCVNGESLRLIIGGFLLIVTERYGVERQRPDGFTSPIKSDDRFPCCARLWLYNS